MPERTSLVQLLAQAWGALTRPFSNRAPPSSPEPRPTRTALRGQSALSAMTRAAQQASDSERKSRDVGSVGGLVETFERQFEGYPGDNRRRIVGVFRHLCQRDEDLSGSLHDLVALANPGHSIEFTGGARAVKAAQQEIELFARRIYPAGGGLDALINNQIAEIVKTGASSCEWFPTPSRDGVQDVAVVPSENIKIARDKASGGLTYTQAYVVSPDILLDPATYCYAPVSTDGDNPHGVPMFISALEAVDRKQRLTEGTDRVIDLMRTLFVASASIPKPTPEELGYRSIEDPGYRDAEQQYFQDALTLMLDTAKVGLFVGPAGTEFNVSNVTHSLAGVMEVILENNRRLWTAAKTLPMMRGYMEHTTQALAQVVYPIVEANAANIQMVLARQLQFGLNLHLKLKGIPAQAWVTFASAPSAFALPEAQADLARMQTDEIGKRLAGDAWYPKFAGRWDVDKDDDQQAPEWWNAPPATSPSGSNIPLNPPAQDGSAAHGPDPDRYTSLTVHYDRKAKRYKRVR